MLPGHPIIFLKSNKFNMAAISVKRSLHRTLSDHTQKSCVPSVTNLLSDHVHFHLLSGETYTKSTSIGARVFWPSIRSLKLPSLCNIGLLRVVLIFWIGSRELVAPKILRIGWKENSIFCPVLTCSFLYFQAPIIH